MYNTMSSSDERASKAQPHHQQTHARRREDLDSILDAALDELDTEEEDDELSDDDNNDDDDYNNEASDNVEHDKNNNNGIASPPSLPQIDFDNLNSDNANYGAESPFSGVDAGGAPYSLEYLTAVAAAAKREKESTARRQFVGPEQPPPPSSFDLHATNMSARAGMESEKGGGDVSFASSAEFVSSLEDMMKQFATEMQSVSGGGGGGGELDMTDEKSLDAMLKTMMFGMEGGGEQQASTRVNKNVPPSSTKNEKLKEKSTNSNNATISNSSSNTKTGASTTAPKTKKKSNNNNVDESINRLLNGINQASSSSFSTNNDNNNNAIPMMMGMEGIDPSQIEQFSTNIMSSIMSEFDKMGTKKDTDTVIDSVMKQLLNKELMYEPMKEVCNRFPTFLASNKDVLSIKEYTRYGNQYQYFQKICHVYETEPDNFVRLMELMQDIQEYGQPPVDIIKELAPDLQFDETGMPIMDPNNMGGMPMMFPGMMGCGGDMPPFPGGMGGDEQCCIS